jgi:hypothetical protein
LFRSRRGILEVEVTLDGAPGMNRHKQYQPTSRTADTSAQVVRGKAWRSAMARNTPHIVRGVAAEKSIHNLLSELVVQLAADMR